MRLYAVVLVAITSACGTDRPPPVDAGPIDATANADAGRSTMDSSTLDAADAHDAASDAGPRIVSTSTTPPASCESACGGANKCDEGHVWLGVATGAGYATYGPNACMQNFLCGDVPPIEVDCVNGRFRLSRYRCACL